MKCEKTTHINLQGFSYPILISGEGQCAVLIIGVGTLMHRTLSQSLRQYITFYSSDLYWVGNHKVDNITMDSLAKDIHSMQQQLGLEKIILLAHSAFGPLAIHVAKLFPKNISGIIMIGTTPGWDDEIIKRNQQQFDLYAGPERKDVDIQQKKLYSDEMLAGMSAHERFLATYADIDRARFWYNPNFDSRPLWLDVTLNFPVVEKYFGELLPVYLIENGIEDVVCPIWLASGVADYDSCPALNWGRLQKKPKDFTIFEFDRSGHYPHYEEPEKFDKSLLGWAQERFFK